MLHREIMPRYAECRQMNHLAHEPRAIAAIPPSLSPRFPSYLHVLYSSARIQHAFSNSISLSRIITPANASFLVVSVMLDGEFTGPFSSCGLVPGSVGLVDVCNLGNQWVVWIRICQHRANRQEHLRYRKSRTPLVSQNI